MAAVEGLLDAADDPPDAANRRVLYDSVDPDALDRVFDSDFTGNLSFTFNGCHVTVTSEQEVHATRLADLE